MDRIMGRGFFVPAMAALLLTMVSGMAFAAATCSGEYMMVPDGRIESVSVTTANDIQAMFMMKSGKSYCIEAHAFEFAPSLVNAAIWAGTSFSCSTGIPAEWIARGGIDPTHGFVPNLARYCRIVTSDEYVVFRIGATSNTTVQMNVTETTLFNPRWSTYNGFLSSWGFQNTTSADINGVLTLNDGATTYAKTLVLPAGVLTYVFSNDATLALGADKAGSATFAHDGPPGGVKGDCYYAKSGVMIPSSFEPAREDRH